MKFYNYKHSEQDPQDLFEPLSRIPYSLFLDSADPDHELSRYSYILFHPTETIESKNGIVTVTNKEQQFSFEHDPFDIVRDRLELYGMEKKHHSDSPPFQGGAAGFFGYDLVRSLEKIPQKTKDNPNMPDMAVGIYDQLYAYDHKNKLGYFMAHAPDENAALARFEHFKKMTTDPAFIRHETDADSQWHTSHSRYQYESAVQKTIDYIYAGDIFQANLSQKFEADLPFGFDPWKHYLTLRTVNPAPFASFMNFGPVKLSSASPERFLHVENRKVETRPIKGTAARTDDKSVDQLYRNMLENSDKDRAENTMIVDLLRNDLSKVCEDHSINVPQLCQVESFAKVHHLVSIVKGLLRADQTPVDLLKACFPGGSITGAPKVRAMEIIEELEQSRRGPYCGAMGYIGYNGTMDTNITIRTLVYEGDKVSFNVGGGVIADSKPAHEYDETMLKAEAIFNSFEIDEQTAHDTDTREKSGT